MVHESSPTYETCFVLFFVFGQRGLVGVIPVYFSENFLDVVDELAVRVRNEFVRDMSIDSCLCIYVVGSTPAP